MLQREDRWDEAGERLAAEARALRRGRRGAARAVHEHDAQGRRRRSTAAIDIPFVHIADTTAHAVRAAGLYDGRPARDRLHDGAGLLRRAACASARARGARARAQADRRIVHDVIYDELCVGSSSDESREEYRRIMRDARRPRRAGHPARLHGDRPARRRRRTRRCRSSTPPGCTPSAPWSLRREARDDQRHQDAQRRDPRGGAARSRSPGPVSRTASAGPISTSITSTPTRSTCSTAS